MYCHLHMHLIAIECHTLCMLSIYLHMFVTLKPLFESDTPCKFFIMLAHIVMWDAVVCIQLQLLVKALKDSCNLQLSWTLLIRIRDYQ